MRPVWAGQDEVGRCATRAVLINGRKGFFEHDMFLPVRRGLPEEIQPVITFAYYTSCR